MNNVVHEPVERRLLRRTLGEEAAELRVVGMPIRADSSAAIEYRHRSPSLPHILHTRSRPAV
jgi:hypothetical protein